MTSKMPMLMEFSKMRIYSPRSRAPKARDGSPSYFDLMYHPTAKQSAAFMSYTGDYGKVYCSHKIVATGPSQFVVNRLNPPEDIGSLSEIYTGDSKVVPFANYLLKDESWTGDLKLDNEVGAVFKAFVDQEYCRLTQHTKI
ncbi:MAG: hypothetical protein S4CHLAM7_02040 [Chlamydiae bacterium]|nr:hypothetical protein [Chlamydiota bacterium]